MESGQALIGSALSLDQWSRGKACGLQDQWECLRSWPVGQGSGSWGCGGIADAGFLWAVQALGRPHVAGVFKSPWVLEKSQFDCTALWV